MKATASLSVVRRGERDVIADQRSHAPFSLRRCGRKVLLASSAAAPVGGDDLSLTIDIGPGASASVGSVAATMVWPGPSGAPSSMVTTCAVGAGGHLDLHLEPTVSVTGSRHHASTVIDLAADATCRVIDEVALGRRSEPSGWLALSQRVVRDDRPLLHHDETFGPDVEGALSSVSVGAARYALSGVFVGIDAGASRTIVESDGAAAWLPAADDAAVALLAAHDRPAALRLFGALCPEFA